MQIIVYVDSLTFNLANELSILLSDRHLTPCLESSGLGNNGTKI